VTDRSATPSSLSRRRMLIGGADLALSSAQNFLLVVLVARQVSTSDLGKFTIVTALAVSAVRLVEACVSEPALLHAADLSDAEKTLAVRSSLTCSILLGLVIGLGTVVTGAIWGNSFGALLALLGVVLPGMLVQDSCRMGALAFGRTTLLLALDIAWVAAWIVTLAVVRPSSTLGEFAVWSFTSWLSAAMGIAIFRYTLRHVRSDVRYWRTELKKSAGSLMNEYSVNTLCRQASTVGISAVASLAAAGVVRAGAVLFGPINIFVGAMKLVVTPEVIRGGGSAGYRSRRILRVTTACGVAATLGLSVVLWLLPSELGSRLLGSTWSPAHSIIPIVGATAALVAANTRSAVALRADRRFPTIARLRNVVGPVEIVCVLVGAALAGYKGAAVGALIAAAIALLVYESTERRVLGLGNDAVEVAATLPQANSVPAAVFVPPPPSNVNG
jgi:O-antigen/teichoic acid export membrane protein